MYHKYNFFVITLTCKQIKSKNLMYWQTNTSENITSLVEVMMQIHHYGIYNKSCAPLSLHSKSHNFC